MKKYTLILFALLCIPITAFSVNSVQENNNDSIQSGIRFVLETFGNLQASKHSLSEKEVALLFEKNLTFPSLTEIEKIDENLILKFNERDSLIEKEGEDYEGIYVLDEQIQDLKLNRELYEDIFQNRKVRQQENIQAYVSEIEDLKEEIDKQKLFIRTQIQNLLYWFLILVTALLVLFGLKKLGTLIIERTTRNYAESTRETLLRINNLIINILIVLIIVGTLFSQITSLLPFIAIFGTGIAFAIRDALSSLVGRFIIDTDRGFRIGDVLKVGDVMGKVSDIGPFVTSVQDMENGMITGSASSFANKAVFEKDIMNLSRSYQFLEKKVSFVISAESDFKKAESILLATTEELLKPHEEEINKFAKRLVHKEGFTAKDLVNRVHWENDSHGIKITVTFLGRLSWINEICSLLNIEYVQRINKTENVFLQYNTIQKSNLAKKKKISSTHSEEHMH